MFILIKIFPVKSSQLTETESHNDPGEITISDVIQHTITDILQTQEAPSSTGSNVDTQSHDSDTQEPAVLLKKNKPIRWKFENAYKTEKEFEAFLKAEKCWSLRSRQKLKRGVKSVYRCNLVPVKGEQCEQQIYTLQYYGSDSTDDEDANGHSIQLYRNSRAHTHQKSKSLKHKMSSPIKKTIVDLHKKISNRYQFFMKLRIMRISQMRRSLQKNKL